MAILMLSATLTLPEPTRYAFAPPVPKEQAGRPSLNGRCVVDRGCNCIGGPLWPPVSLSPRTGGHRGPPLQLFPIEQIRRVIGDAGEWCNNLIDLLLGFGFGTDEESGDDVADAGRDRQ